jgi:cell division septation protein DedD
LRAFDCDVTGKRIMAWHWRRLALAASAAAAMGMVCAVSVEAQTPPKSATKSKAKAKAAKQEEPAEQEQDEDAPAPKPKKAKQDPAQAQKTIASAAKLLEAGKASEAAQALTSVLSGGNLPPAIMAKALLYRGIAYRQQKLPAQAIADLTSALWLKGGLSEGDRADALRQRTAAYQEAGLADGGGAVAAAVPNATRSATRTASADQGWSTATTNQGSAESPAPAQSSSGWSLGNAFAGLFGGTSSPPTPTAAPPPAAPETTASIEPARPPQAAEPSASRPRTSAWSRNTEVSPAAAAAPAAASAPAAAKPDGRFRIQVGMVRSEGEAQALAGKVRREHAAALASREPEVDQTVVGNMGSFYRVRVGPYATQADGQAACAKLKGSGLDCMVVAQ